MIGKVGGGGDTCRTVYPPRSAHYDCPPDPHRLARPCRGPAPTQGRFIYGGFSGRPVSGVTFDCISPIDGRVIANVAAGDAPDIDAAVASATGQPSSAGDWSRRAHGTQARAAAFRRERSARARGTRADRDAGHGQAHPRQPGGGRAIHGPLHPVVRRSHRQDLRRGRAHGA